MTYYSIYLAGRPYGYPLAAKDKGDITNRMQCAYEQTKNTAIHTAKAGVVTAGTAAAVYGVLKSPFLSNSCLKAADKVLQFGGKLIKSIVGKNNTYYSKVAQLVKNLPAKAKIAGYLAMPALAVIASLGSRMTYKAGQIDQKYTDKALMEQKLKDAMIDF